MGWQLQVGERVIRFDDLPPTLFQKVADKYDTRWLDLYFAPVANTDAFTELVREICAHEQLDPPSMGTIGELLKVWQDQVTEASDDLPTQFGEGGVPLTDGQTTDSSSVSG
jgi:hypothetical protein